MRARSPINFLPVATRSMVVTRQSCRNSAPGSTASTRRSKRSEEHTSELQSQFHIVCRLLLEKKKNTTSIKQNYTVKWMCTDVVPVATRSTSENHTNAFQIALNSC